MKRVNQLAAFINERERIRVLKDNDAPKPWTKDPILQQYRFCNVHREDDKVTRWIAKNWRSPHAKDKNLWHAMIVARFINWPDTLQEVGYPEPWSEMLPVIYSRLRGRQAREEKVFTGAYIVSTNGRKMDKVDFVVDLFHGAWHAGWGKFATLADAWTHLNSIKGLGSFMAAQVVADLKHTPMLRHAEDWYDWAAPGPGSLRGLSIVLGGDGSAVDSNRYRNPEVFIARLLVLRTAIEPLLHIETRLCLQDLQNCLCEFRKYVRGYSRSRYDGNPRQ